MRLTVGVACEEFSVSLLLYVHVVHIEKIYIIGSIYENKFCNVVQILALSCKFVVCMGGTWRYQMGKKFRVEEGGSDRQGWGME